MDAEDVVLKICENQEELQKSFGLRLHVFCKEQTFSEEIEVDGNDSPFPRPDVLHIIAMNTNGTILGTVRMLRQGEYAKLGRLAVSKQARGLHIGQKLVTRAEAAVARAWNTKRVVISSQWQVEAFYIKCGYTLTGNEEMDEGWRRVDVELDKVLQ